MQCKNVTLVIYRAYWTILLRINLTQIKLCYRGFNPAALVSDPLRGFCNVISLKIFTEFRRLSATELVCATLELHNN